MKNIQWQQGLIIYAPAILLVIAAFSIAFHFIKPAPPNTLTIATGNINGAYHAFALRYKEELQQDGIELILKPTKGSIENLQLLASKKVDLAFVQGGTADKSLELNSLASLYYEPLWLFVKKDLNIQHLSDLKSKTIFIGSEGSGTKSLVKQLLEANEIDATQITFSNLNATAAKAALQQQTIDAAFFVSSVSSPLIQELLQNDAIKLSSLSRAPAYTRHFSFLSELHLPEGALDLTNNIPSQDIQLLAATANLVSTTDVDPSVMGLLLQAAAETHGNAGIFSKQGQFPSNTHLIFKQSKASKRYFKYGPPFLQRYMPFWAASLIDRIKILLLPLIILLLPLFKFMPSIYRWRMRARIYRWYDKLEAIDIMVGKDQAEDLLDQLDHIEDDVKHVRVPLSFADSLYHLREHIDLVRKRIEQSNHS